MSLPPDRISVKRHRQDDPVETLYLERSNVPNQKRRFTEFVFLRIQSDRLGTTVPVSSTSQTRTQTSAADLTLPGNVPVSAVPLVQATRPGDEIRDAQQRRAERQARHEVSSTKSNPSRMSEVGDMGTSHVITAPGPTAGRVDALAVARRFHLSREYSPLAPLKQSGGIRKRNAHAKRHLATFIEKGLEMLSATPRAPHRARPVDRIVPSSHVASDGLGMTALTSQRDVPVESFVKITTPIAKTGRSMRDHPSTWDLESDRLADELAAFALEFDDPEKTMVPSDAHLDADKVTTSKPAPVVDEDQDYIYETYVRVTHDSATDVKLDGTDAAARVGVLVIEEQDEELWEAYADSDDDTDWDEEDADSNAEDNPANDYPEDEIGLDDEFGYHTYTHRHNASDEEEYDLDDDEDDNYV